MPILLSLTCFVLIPILPYLGLGPRNSFWTICSQMAYQGPSSEPWHQFLKRTPHFLQNYV